MRRPWLIIVAVAVAAVAVAYGLRSQEQPSTTATVTTTTTTTIAPSSTLAPHASPCDPYQVILTSGTVENPALFETSGIAASRLTPGAIWAHNDSGDDPTIYAIGPNGEDLGSFTVGGGLAFDWEDLAVGPGVDGDGSYLYVGDIGDNLGIRGGRIVVYVLPEPDPNEIAASVVVDRVYRLKAPDGPHNFEALFVADGTIYVATKDREATQIYRGDPEGAVLELVATVNLGAEVTAADVSWDGTTIAFRGYENIWMWLRQPDATIAETLADEPCVAPSPHEEQGEALAFLEDGAIVTISEGEHPEIHLVPRAS